VVSFGFTFSDEKKKKKVQHCYSGPIYENVEFISGMNNCDASAPLMIQIVKLYSSSDATKFDAFGRVFSGTIKSGQLVKVLGEGYSPDDEEDMVTATVDDVWIFESRYRIPTSAITAGNWVLLAGVDASIVKTATITDLLSSDEEDSPHIFRPLRFNTQAVLKIAVEPVNPTELPKMLDGLRKVNKSYPILSTKVITLLTYSNVFPPFFFLSLSFFFPS